MAFNAPFGFRPVRYLNGSPYNGAVTHVAASASTTAIALGQPVALATDGGVVAVSATGQLVYGYAMGFSPNVTNGVMNATVPFQNAKGTTDNGQLHVALADGLVCEVQMADGNIATVADIGGGVDIANSAPNMTFGVARCEVTDPSATARMFRMVGLSTDADNDTTATFRNVLVVASETFFAATAPGVI